MIRPTNNRRPPCSDVRKTRNGSRGSASETRKPLTITIAISAVLGDASVSADPPAVAPRVSLESVPRNTLFPGSLNS